MIDLNSKNKKFINELLNKNPDIHLKSIYKTVKNLNTKEISNESVKEYVKKMRTIQKGGNLDGYHGFKNCGNSCFMNASIQLLYLNKSFRELVKTKPNKNNINKAEAEIKEAEKTKVNTDKAKGIILWNLFHHIFEKLDEKNNAEIDLSNFTIDNNNINVYEKLFNLTINDNLKTQQDIQEFIVIVLNLILECFNENEQHKLKLKESTTKSCKNSTKEITNDEYQNMIMLKVGDITENANNNISDYLDHYQSDINTTNDSQYMDSCKSNSDQTGVIKSEKHIYDISNIEYLNIAVGRYEYKINTYTKNKRKININENLTINNVEFKLISFIEHLGDSPNSGHYIAYKYIYSNKIIKFDDSTVSTINNNNSIIKLNENVVFLLYEKSQDKSNKSQKEISILKEYAIEFGFDLNKTSKGDFRKIYRQEALKYYPNRAKQKSTKIESENKKNKYLEDAKNKWQKLQELKNYYNKLPNNSSTTSSSSSSTTSSSSSSTNNSSTKSNSSSSKTTSPTFNSPKTSSNPPKTSPNKSSAQQSQKSVFTNEKIKKTTENIDSLKTNVSSISTKLNNLIKNIQKKSNLSGGSIQTGGNTITQNDIDSYINILNKINNAALLKEFIPKTYKIITDLWNPNDNKELQNFLESNKNHELHQYFTKHNNKYYFNDIKFAQIMIGKLGSQQYPNNISGNILKKYINNKQKK